MAGAGARARAGLQKKLESFNTVKTLTATFKAFKVLKVSKVAQALAQPLKLCYRWGRPLTPPTLKAFKPPLKLSRFERF